MKIVCNKNELVMLVRECTLMQAGESCSDCLFYAVCAGYADVVEEGYIMESIEDICEIEGDR